jgi:predicted DsbA family dithiol-disulfide isomerase
MKVEVFSDVVCPWCYLGKRRLESALAERGGPAEVTWRAFQLQPDAPRFGEPGAGEPSQKMLAARGYEPAQLAEAQGRLTELAAAEGLEYALERSLSVNSFDAHCLAKAAARQGLGAEMVERLFRGQFVEGLRLDDPAELARLAAEVGVPDPEPAAADVGAVEEDLEEATEIGVTGVPFFVFDRKIAVGGAQSSELLGEAMRRAEAEPAA